MSALRVRLLAVMVVAGWLLAAVMFGAGVAKADLSNAEIAYVNTYGATAICPTIAAYPSTAGVTGVLSVILDDGFTPQGAADIVNAAVAVYCPQYWGLIQAIGDAARAQQQRVGPLI